MGAVQWPKRSRPCRRRKHAQPDRRRKWLGPVLGLRRSMPAAERRRQRPVCPTATCSESHLVKLVLRSDTDLEFIIRYWSGGLRQKSLRTLLENAKPRGAETVRLDVVHLLSPFLRALAYTYPLPGDPPRDCHWTTLNFFENLPFDDRYLDPDVVQQAFSARFERIGRKSARYGDVVALVDDRGLVNHTAIYLAEDLVFSKNGNTLYSPGIITQSISWSGCIRSRPQAKWCFYAGARCDGDRLSGASRPFVRQDVRQDAQKNTA